MPATIPGIQSTGSQILQLHALWKLQPDGENDEEYSSVPMVSSITYDPYSMSKSLSLASYVNLKIGTPPCPTELTRTLSSHSSVACAWRAA
eukprot:4740155-Prymnesium_polylepis.1